MFPRLCRPVPANSFFLFGARGTGKTTLLENLFFGSNKQQKYKNIIHIDLLRSDHEDLYSRRPDELFDQLQAEKNPAKCLVIIDEIQKVPKLLDIAHRSIEKLKVKFAMTGSSARKLKKESVNLLAGRAFINYLFPLTHLELGESFDLDTVLKWGSLPKIFSLKKESERRGFLSSYVHIYLKEEIWAEHFIRKLDPFRNFMEIASQSNGHLLNYSNIARDVGVDHKTIKEYFSILEDTLLAFFIPPFYRSIRKQQSQAQKFYLFDLGITRALNRQMNIPAYKSTYSYGKSFEHFLIAEMVRLNYYKKLDYRFYYLRNKDGLEIDLIIDRPGLPEVLLEIKSSKRIDDRDTRVLEHFKKDFSGSQLFCLSNDMNKKRIKNVLCLPWKEGLQELGF